MTVKVQYPTKTFLGNGTASPLNFDKRFLDNADLVVTHVAASGTRTVLIEASDYTVSGAGSLDGGQITPMSAIALGDKWEVSRTTALMQPTDYADGDDFPAESHELALDRQMMIMQELVAETDNVKSRSLLAPVGQTAPDLDISGLTDGDLLHYKDGKVQRLKREPFAGKFYAGDATGGLIPATGTGGGDAALRGDIAAPTGAELIGGVQDGIGAIPESLQIMVRRQGIYPEQFGAKGDGVTDDLAAILLARDAVLANPGTPLVFQNAQYAISGTVDLTGVMVVQSRRAALIPTFDGIAVKYDPGAAALLQGPRIEGDLAVQWATADWTKDRVGFYLSNVYSGEFGISVARATRGIRLHGNTKGCVYNQFHIRELHSCNVSAWLSSETAAGWSNANEFLGGRWYGDGDVTGALFEAEAGHIYFDDSLYSNNGNRFLDNSLEWNGAGFRLARMGGLRNRLAPKYCELDNGDTTWILDTGTENTIDADNVPYINGYDPTVSGALNRIDVSGATRPHVIGTSEFKEAQNQTQYFETTSLTGPVIRARNKSTGAGLAARTSSPSNFAIVAEHLNGTLGVGIPAAGVWLAKRNSTGTIERKIDWNSGINSPPSSGTWKAGDIVRRHGASASTPVLADVCISAGTPGGWRAKDWIVIKGTTAGRPTLLATDIGVEYLDTTLAAAGKPIWWTGTDWVDATGAVV